MANFAVMDHAIGVESFQAFISCAVASQSKLSLQASPH